MCDSVCLRFFFVFLGLGTALSSLRIVAATPGVTARGPKTGAAVCV